VTGKKNNRIGQAARPTHMIILSFLVIIIIGAVLLSMPWSVKGNRLNFIDALFTAVSATCVTGLTIVDIGREFTLFGQIVVLILIQLGGLGIMTFSTFFVYVLGRRLSLRERDIIDSTLTHTPVQNIGRLLVKIMMIVFTLESIGAAVLTARFLSYYPVKKAVYHGVFHAVSAFCNAGFSLYSTSLIKYRSDIWVNSTIMVLIILGGVGFIVLLELKRMLHISPGSWKNVLSFHSKIVLTTSLFLIVTGTFFIYWVEYSHTLKDLGPGIGFMAALFQSVTARTAGFNTLSIGSLTNGALFVIMFLMFIGAAPGSCGGGVKVTTLGIFLNLFISKLRGSSEPHIFNRTISQQMTSKAFTIVLSSVLIIGLIFYGLLLSEDWSKIPGASRSDFVSLFFETISAFGTVGLSMGITPELTKIGRILIILLMFIGRLGPLTLAVALERPRYGINYRYAKGEIMVG